METPLTRFRVATEGLNHLRLRNARRIAVTMGDIDAVFEPVTTVHGKKQRLSALGHYYEPFTAATGSTVSEAYSNCLAYWKDKRERAIGHAFASAADLEADMQAQIRGFVVEGGKLPPPGTEIKLRLPGALTFNNMDDLGDGGAADGTPLPSIRFNEETAMWNGNPALGKIPMVVRVEVNRRGAWKPATDDWVHFQLIPPFHDDPGAELAEVNALRNTSQRPKTKKWKGGPAEPAGPRQFLTAALNHAFDATDPQRYNAHESRGGKRGLSVLRNIFDALPAARFPDMNALEAAPAPRKHAVRCRTNAKGEAGVLFLPSRMGGDRYRLRIFLDPNAGLASDGTEPDAAAFETGRLCIWRHILWSNYLPKPAPKYPPLNTIAGVQARLTTLGYDVGPIDGHASTHTSDAIREFQGNHDLPETGDWSDAATQAGVSRRLHAYIEGGGKYDAFGPHLAPLQFAEAIAEFRKMYCELEIEPAITDPVHPMELTAAQYQPALRWAIGQAQLLQGTYHLSDRRDVAAMFSDEFETPFLFEIRHPHHYNRVRQVGVPPPKAGPKFVGYWKDASKIIYAENGLIVHLVRYLTGKASPSNPPTPSITRYSTPGLTVLAAISSSRLLLAPKESGQVAVPTTDDAQSSGFSTQERGTTVYAGEPIYASWIYGKDCFTKNVLHEMGHLLHLRHQFISTWLHHDSFREDHASTAAIADPTAVPASVPYDRCLMGYLPCDGDFCGKCHLKLRGWDISRIPV